MKVKKNKIIQELSLIPFGAKGWMSNSTIECPECKKSGKFGISITETSGGVHCFICDYKEGIVGYLKKIKREDLLEFEQSVSIESKLPKISFSNEKTEELIEEVILPKGFKRINYDKYLLDRNFRSYQYEQFQVGVTDNILERRLENYLIFQLFQQGRLVGWLARSKYSKEWHKENLRRHKEFGEKLVLRYRNSTGTDFSKIIGGYDEITENTHTLIGVEGLFDKTNISNHLRTNDSEELKVIFTFGNSFSIEQINLLRKTNVKNIILMYDHGTVKQSKQYSMELSRWFNVDVCLIEDEEIDPGNISEKYLSEILKNKKNFIYFYNSVMKNLKLQQ